MPNALSTPTTLGLYINSFTKRGSSTNPYKQLLGTDGFGNYSGGNKLDSLFNYTNQFGYNYGIFYDLANPKPGDDLVFTNAVTDETFLPLGLSVLNTVMPQAHAAGLIDRAAVCDVFRPQMIPVGTQYKTYDGISQVKKIINYNNSVFNDPTKRFSWINFETEFWNFPALGATTSTGTVNISNFYGTGSNEPGMRKTASAPANIFAGIAVNDFVKFGNEWRQVISIGTNTLLVDRPWGTVSGAASTFQYLHSGSTVDYETFLYRVTKACQYINQFGNGEQVDIYVGFPQYADGTQQLARLYQAGVTRILLTNYQKVPNWSYIDGNYANAPTSYHKVSDDIVSDGELRQLGFIISVESATNNNSSCPTQSTPNNFAGYFFEGRSITPHSGSTDFKPLDVSGNVVNSCNCCASPVLYPPPPTWNSIQLDEAWQYTAETAPSGAGYVTKASNTFNDVIAGGGTTGTNLDNYINLDTMVIFDQEFMRQLVISPAVSLNYSVSIQDVSCNGSDDGMLSLYITGGTQPYSFDWEIYDTGTSTWIPFTGTGTGTDQITFLAPGDYRCTIEDADLNTITTSTITVTEPTALGVLDFEFTDASCDGTLGSVRINQVVGGYGNYSATVVLSGGTPTGWVPFTSVTPLLTFSNLAAGDYDIYLADGNPNDGCYAIQPFTISTTALGNITGTRTNPTCNGGFGSITTSPASSYDAYNLYDNTSALIQTNTTGVFNNLQAGVYTVQATTGACTTNTISLTITNPTAVTLSNVLTNPDCYQGTNGSIVSTASGSTGPYSYTLQYPSGLQISNSSGNFVNLPAGNYLVYAESAVSCFSNIYSVSIVNPDQVVAEYAVTQPITGASTTGSITLQSVSGGSGTYQYLWSTGATTDSLTDLEPGDYTVIVSDQNDCSSTYRFTIRVECPTFTLEEMKVAAYKAQCCAGNLGLKYIRLIKEGRTDLASKILNDLKVLTMIIETFYCTNEPGSEPRISCEEMQSLFDKINKLCDCDCCKDPNTEIINVTYDPITGSINKV